MKAFLRAVAQSSARSILICVRISWVSSFLPRRRARISTTLAASAVAMATGITGAPAVAAAAPAPAMAMAPSRRFAISLCDLLSAVLMSSPRWRTWAGVSRLIGGHRFIRCGREEIKGICSENGGGVQTRKPARRAPMKKQGEPGNRKGRGKAECRVQNAERERQPSFAPSTGSGLRRVKFRIERPCSIALQGFAALRRGL